MMHMTIDEAGKAAAGQHGIIYLGAMPDEGATLVEFNFKNSNKGFNMWVDSPGQVAAAVAEAVALGKKRVMG